MATSAPWGPSFGDRGAARPPIGLRRGATPTLPVLAVDLATARAHARVGADLVAAGSRVGPNDLWLAAGALAHGLTLVTANLREFGRVPGLQVETWGGESQAQP